MPAIQFSSNEYAPHVRKQAIEHIWTDQLQMDVDFVDDQQPSFEMNAFALSDVVQITAISGTSSKLARSAERAAACASDLMLCIADNVNVRVRKAHSDAVYSAGNAHVWMADKSTSIEVDGGYSAFMMSLPSDIVLQAGVDLDRVLEQGVPANVVETRLLRAYGANLFGEFDRLDSITAEHAAVHLRDLALFALSSKQGREHNDFNQGARAARLVRIKADIQANLQNPDLSAGWIAAREGISARYLRDLFALEQNNFTDFVLHQRLQRAHLLLTGTHQLRQRISEIAYNCGFGDLSYFNRSFKKRFGATPSEIREQLNHW